MSAGSLDAAWAGLAQQIAWADQFWIGWVFAEPGPDEATLRARAAAAVAENGQALLDLPIHDEASLRAALESFGEASARLSWARLRASGEEGARLWSALHLRLNERRATVRQNSPGGLVLVAPLALKAAARDAAPDLWSARSLLLEVAPRPSPAAEAPRGALRMSLPPLRAHEAGLFMAGGGRAAATRALLDEALRALEDGHPAVAYDRAMAALQGAEAPADAALAALRAAEAQTAQGRSGSARALLERAVSEAREAPAPTLAWSALIRLSLLRERSGELDGAEAAAAEARSWAQRVPEPAEALRRGALAAQQQGEVAAKRGDLGVAARHLSAAIEMGRAYLAQVGPAPGALGPLANALGVLSAVERDRGALAAALMLAEEAVAVSRQRRPRAPAAPELIGVQVDALIALSRAQLAQGSPSGARAAVEAAVQLARRAPPADRAPMLGASLWHLANVHRAAHAWDLSRNASLEAIEVYREAIQDAPEGAAQDLRLELAEALHLLSIAALDEAVALQRELGGDVTEMPELVTDLAETLTQRARLALEAGEASAAQTAAVEALSLGEAWAARAEEAAAWAAEAADAQRPAGPAEPAA